VSTSRGEIDEECLAFIDRGDEVLLGVDGHSFKHQEIVHTVTKVKKRKVPGILEDDRIAALKRFLSKIHRDKVKEICIDMKEGLRKTVEGLFSEAKIMVNPFHVIADPNRRMDEAWGGET
jgi:transposase